MVVGNLREAIELDEVEAAVGPRAFQRGRGYAHGRRVLSLDWDGEELSGMVMGHGALYSTTACFIEGRRGLEFQEGECNCPVGYD